jgi:transcriptional regulator with GAF, ATPase, and Fis domain
MRSHEPEPRESAVRLVAISGPLNGTDSHLRENWKEISIGRDDLNDICVDSRSVSRRHCVIERRGSELVIRDLDSRNGTFVNDVPVKERTLRRGDQISVGDSVFILVIDDEKPAAPAPHPHPDDTAMVSVNVVGLSPDDSIYIKKDALAATMPRSSRVLNNLNTLLDISTRISSVQDIEELQEKLLTSLADVMPAEHAAILFVGEDGPESESSNGWSRSQGMGTTVKPSRTIVKQVVDTRKALLAQGFLSGPLSGVESIAASKVRSVLCVPIQILGKILGVVYMGTSHSEAPFDDDHLQFLTAVASIAAVAINNVRQMEFLKGENQRLSKEIELNHNMVGESNAMRHVYQIVAKVAPANSTVLINGESGTGKELVARAIHANSPRADKPFIAINCAAIPETLLESELFGSEKGAYTGAPQRRGKLEIAEGGTILLDEIGELPLALQAKLLRVLQERVFERLGGTRPIPVNVRWLAATNRDLKQAIQDRTFREDLYFRLQVITIRLPALRERREDIPLLCGYFAHKYSKLCGRPVKGISPEAKARLVHYDWPGNVRELENTMERAIVMGAGDYVLPEDLSENLIESEPPPGVDTAEYHQLVKEAKQRIVRSALDRHSGNVSEAAKQLGIHPNNLHRLIRNLGIK